MLSEVSTLEFNLHYRLSSYGVVSINLSPPLRTQFWVLGSRARLRHNDVTFSNVVLLRGCDQTSYKYTLLLDKACLVLYYLLIE